MAIEVEVDGLPDILEFDEGTSPDIIQGVVKQRLARQKFYSGIQAQMGQAQAEGAAAQKVLSEREANEATYGPIAQRISWGGLSKLAGAAAKDFLSDEVMSPPRALLAELKGEPTPADIEADIRGSTLKQIGVGAAELAPKVAGTAALATVFPPALPAMAASAIAGGTVFGTSAAEESGGELVPTLKGAGFGAAFPVAGALGRIGAGVAASALIRTYGTRVLQNPIVQRMLEAGSAQVPIQWAMMVDLMNSEEYKNATPAEQNRMLLVNFGVNAVYGVKDAYDALKSGTPIATRILQEQGGLPPNVLARELAGQLGQTQPEIQSVEPNPLARNIDILPSAPLTKNSLLDVFALMPPRAAGPTINAEQRRAAIESGLTMPQGNEPRPLSGGQRRQIQADIERRQGLRPGRREELEQPESPVDAPIQPTPQALATREWNDAVSAIAGADAQGIRDLALPTLDSGSQAIERIIGILERAGINAEPEYRMLLKADREINRKLQLPPEQGGQNAIQEQGANAGVLREEGPTVGLRGVAQEEPQAPGTQTTVPQEPKTTGGLTPEEQAAAQAELDQALGQTREYEMSLIPGGRQLGQAVGQAASAYRRLRRRGQAPAALPGSVPGQQQAPGGTPPPPGAPAAAVPPAGGTPPGGGPTGGGMPPLPPGGFAPGGAGRPLKGFAEVDRVFGAPDIKVPKPGEIASKIIEGTRTGFSSKHRGAGWLQEQIEKFYGLPRDPRRLDAYLESLKGASGQAAVDVMRFDEAVMPLVNDISAKDFNRFLFARRVLDRLRDDPTIKQVDDWTIDDAQNVLGRLMDKLGPDRWQRIQQAGKIYNDFADIALQSMLHTGRINQNTYNWIKAHNKFYAPFVVMERAWEQQERVPPGAGRQVDTQAELTKPITGIRDSEFHLADMMQAMRRQIVTARTLAEKQRRMHALAELATSDTQGKFIRPLAPNEEPAKGKETVTVLEDGEPVQYEVDPNVATAFKMHNNEVGKVMRNVLRVSSPLFRAGATSANLVFQGVNMGLADQPRLAIMSKLGPNNWRDIYRYPMDFLQAAMSAAYGNRLVEGAPPDKLYRDFLESGAAGATMQSQFTPDALTYHEPASLRNMLGKARNILDNPARAANAVEETTKIMGIKRAMRMTGAKSGAELARRFPQMVTEVRRFSGSPDFGRAGSVTDRYGLNLLFMFSNPRIQGAVSDIGRLAGRDGADTAAKTWAKIATTVGPATLAAWWYIHRNKDYEKDYNLLSDQEKKNYFMIPKNQFIINSKGERVRDWWRIPKRETTKLIANTIEAGLEWWKTKDPKGLAKWGEGIIEDLSPVNISGRNLGERGQSIVSSMNPIVKTPAEVLFNINTYTHQPLISDPRMLAIEEKYPEQQFRQNTPEFFKRWALWMPDWTPPFMRSPVKLQNMLQNVSASLITQYLPTEPVEGRTTALELNRFMKRFQTSGFIETPEFRDRLKSLQADQALESLQRERTAVDMINRNKNDLNAAVIEARKTRDKNLAVRVKEMVRMQRAGVSSNDKQLLNLAPRQRAQMIAEQVADMDKENSQKYLQTLRRGRILSDDTRRELQRIQQALQPIRTRPTGSVQEAPIQPAPPAP